MCACGAAGLVLFQVLALVVFVLKLLPGWCSRLRRFHVIVLVLALVFVWSSRPRSVAGPLVNLELAPMVVRCGRPCLISGAGAHRLCAEAFCLCGAASFGLKSSTRCWHLRLPGTAARVLLQVSSSTSSSPWIPLNTGQCNPLCCGCDAPSNSQVVALLAPAAPSCTMSVALEAQAWCQYLNRACRAVPASPNSSVPAAYRGALASGAHSVAAAVKRAARSR
jgi:hypothetical protein